MTVMMIMRMGMWVHRHDRVCHRVREVERKGWIHHVWHHHWQWWRHHAGWELHLGRVAAAAAAAAIVTDDADLGIVHHATATTARCVHNQAVVVTIVAVVERWHY